MILDNDDVWFRISAHDQWVYDHVLPYDSPLLDVFETVDWDALDAQLRQRYCPDCGQPGYPPLIMLKLELLRYFYNLSDRQVIERCRSDMLFRFFLQIGVISKLPHPTSLTRFRGRFGGEGFTEIFDQLVAQAREAGLIRDHLRLKDASHVIANIAVPTTLALLAQLRDKMLAAIQGVDPVSAEGFRIDLASARRSDEAADEETKLQSRLNLVTNMLQWIEEQSAGTDQRSEDPAWRKLQSVRELAEKILGDVADPTRGDRTRSVVDPEARRGKHGEYFDGYLVDVLMDSESELITAMDVLPANGDEAADAIALIEHEQQAHGNTIEQLSIDGIGFNGEVLHTLEDSDGLNIDVITPPKNFSTSEGFPSSAFELCEDDTRVRCPAGEVSGVGNTRADKPNTTFFTFPKKACQGCPLLGQCHPGMKPGSHKGRRVSKNRYEADYERARAKVGTPQYQAARKRHPVIERKLGEMLRHHRGRRARYWGLAKVKIQQLMTAMVVNVKRMVRLINRPSLALEG